jgi:phosphatidylinositol alpha-mannosyltransferase
VRVALACPYAWDAPGGVQGHVIQLADQLRSLGHATLVLIPGWSGEAGSGVRVIGRPVRLRFNGSVAAICPDPRSRARIRRALEDFRPDVVHVHEPFAPSTGMFATLEARVPVVGTFHAYAEGSFVLGVFAPLLRRIWNRVGVRVAVSSAAAEFVRRHFEGPMRVVPNGVEVDFFRGATPAQLPPGRRILFVNRLEPRKGFSDALRAFALLAEELPDTSLLVAGEGSERKALLELPPPARSRVSMLGRVPHADLPPYHAASDVFVAPSTGGESFGIVLVEAMAAGLPVVASDIPGYREVVRDGAEGLLVPPRDPVRLAQGIRRVLTDPALAQRLAAAGRVRADRFAWPIVAEEIEVAYRDAVAL